MNCDANDPGFEHLTDEQIVNRAGSREANDKALGEEDDEPTTENRITHDEPLKRATCLLDCFEQDNDVLFANQYVVNASVPSPVVVAD
ncbi:hypothetical protein QYM36_010630 [Artemia franciscana]|uniref:Uncharacterized protein n=1 Tax=Artemia franciscana TaxID=6661 RepID=A0AA88I6D6_ARTSF|nr:hypothetical protein QYM36_010630 [Artemia franciscana]